MFFAVSRLWMLCLSFVLDFSLFQILRRTNPRDALRHLVCFASSWPVLVLCVRPFSNTLEAVAVAVVVALVSSDGRCSRLQCYAVAAFAVAGLWVRVTTLAFLAPSAVYHIARLLKARDVSLFAQSVCAILFAASAFVLLDTHFYGASLHRDGTGTGLTVTPWNLFLYNSNTSNLANHGLHPRVTHAAVSMPMLLTAALPLLYRRVFVIARNMARGRVSWLHTDALLASTVLVGIVALSVFPHQEPRFLLPLLVPSFALLSTTSWLSSRRMQYAWAFANAVLVLFWGGLHQGALLPALFSLSADPGACSIAVAGTYSAPATAAASCVSVGQCSSPPVASLEGASVLEIDTFLQTALRRRCVFLVAPASHPLCVTRDCTRRAAVQPTPQTPLLLQVGWLGSRRQRLPGLRHISVAAHLHRVRSATPRDLFRSVSFCCSHFVDFADFCPM